MANLKQAKTDADLRKLTVNDVKKAYHELALDYNHLLNFDIVYCPHCGKWKSSTAFYGSDESKDNPSTGAALAGGWRTHPPS